MIYSCDNCGRLEMDVVRSKCKECITTNNPTDKPSWWIPDDKPDMVNNPQHYQSENGLEVIDVIEAFTAELKGIDAVCTANAIKYICRWNKKNGIEDLKKAEWYLQRLIRHRELEEAKSKLITK